MSNKHVASITSEALETGFNASLWARQKDHNSLVNTKFITVKHDQDPVKKLRECTENKSALVVVYGPMGDAHTSRTQSVLKELNVVGFAPFTGSSEVRGWNPHLYFLRPDPAAELAALIRYAVAYLRVRRLGFMHLHGVSYGEREFELAVEWLTQMGYEFCCVFSVPTSFEKPAEDRTFDAAYEQFIAGRPQALLLFGSPLHDTEKFIERFLSDERASGVSLLVPVYIQNTFMLCVKKVYDRDGKVSTGTIVITGTTPLPNDKRYDAIKRFHKEITEFFDAHKEVKEAINSKGLHLDDSHGAHLAHGWIMGEVLSRALSAKEWLKDQTTFRESLFNQRRYIVDDLVFGDFGGECSEKVASRGAICRCNQGGSVVYLKRILENSRVVPLRSGRITLGTVNCYMNTVRLHPPLNGLFILTKDQTIVNRANSIMFSGAVTLNGDGSLGNTDRVFMHLLNTTESDAPDALERELTTRITTAVFGVVDSSILNHNGVAFIDPIPLAPRLNSHRPDVIHLSPTVEQQFFVLAKYLTHNAFARPQAVIRNEAAADFIDVLYETMATHRSSLGHATLLSADDEMKDKLPRSGDVFVVGLSADDVPYLVSHLQECQDLRVFLLFSDFALHYDLLSELFQSGLGAERLLFATHLPHWADTNAKSTTIKKYHAAVREPKLWSPLSLLGFTTARVMQEVVQHQDRMNPKALVDCFYADIMVIVDDMRYGPFHSDNCGAVSGLQLETCSVNYGATNISVWSMARALDASVREAYPPTTPSMVYRSRTVLGLSVPTFVWSLFAMLSLVALLFALIVLRFRGDARDNRNAPRKPTEPVTLVFTDIESSTALWAACPSLMREAVASHHRLIRALIVRHGCYEVKTIGDSFMIACRNPFTALQLAQELQQVFLAYNWCTTEIDKLYREFEVLAAEEDVESRPTTAFLDPSAYNELWNGLRVRVGLHTGLCDIRYDEVTKGYDYYGSTANVAARTEAVAHGGQILLTRATYMALKADERQRLDVTPVGPVPLRGAPVAVEMFQLNAVPGRSFRPLRIDPDIYDRFNDDGSISDSGQCSMELNCAARMVAVSMHTLLSTFTTSERHKVLLSCCDRWSIPVPKRGLYAWSEDVYEDTINRIAVTVGNVAEPKIKSAVEREMCVNGCQNSYSFHETNTFEKVSQLSSSDRRAASQRYDLRSPYLNSFQSE
ncbi:Adenylate and Guanylate cyclase catalytic domain [Trypanosoma vivax]|nr:Adenylate and Guanylate cyclase catalytic domain [Trypanosoma vivax]